MTLTVIFPQIRPIRPERSVRWGDRPKRTEHLKKNVPGYRYQQERGELRTLFTFHYCTVVDVSATSDTARLPCHRYLPTTTRSVMDLWLSQPWTWRGTTMCNGTRYFCRLCLHSRIAVRGGIEMRNSAKHSTFCE